MKVYIYGHDFKYETEKLIRIFFPFEKIEFTCENPEECEIKAIRRGDVLSAEVSLLSEKAEFSDTLRTDDEKKAEKALAVLLYKCLSEITGYSSEWGILTGVRPAKLYKRTADEYGFAYADKYFSEKLLVSDKKINLCKFTCKSEEKIISYSGSKSFSLYIGIPFCPTKCSYCSFVSHSVEKAKKLIPQYVQKLCEEIKYTAEIAKNLDLVLETIYIGGGTPTSLSAEQLSEITKTVRENFDLSTVREFTVEAGRPDTVTTEKLLAIKSGGADRISINPQTMNDDILKVIGRNHTVRQTVDAMLAAKKVGFKNINADLIAGLPTDTLPNFKNTVDEVLKLQPESVTVHTLSMKKSARLTLEGNRELLLFGDETAKMLEYAEKRLRENGILPYYMYRQSKMVGNLENVGYAKVGCEGLYNVYIMDETHTILACGATAVTKLRKHGENVIERIYNFKYPYEYISRFDEMLARKKRIYSFYGQTE